MPTDPLTPADLRPGQRVRITRRREGGAHVVEGEVAYASDNGCIVLSWCYFRATPPAGYTQTFEVIE